MGTQYTQTSPKGFIGEHTPLNPQDYLYPVVSASSWARLHSPRRRPEAPKTAGAPALKEEEVSFPADPLPRPM